MQMPVVSQSDILAFVVTTGFAAGLNVYATAFSLGLMARLHWIELPVALELLASTGILVASGCLFAVEVFADKVPGFDLIWNALHTFVRIPVAALMAYAAGSGLSPEAGAGYVPGRSVCGDCSWFKDGSTGCGDAEPGAGVEYCVEYG